MEDLRLLGAETALGYSSMYYDMAQVLWPMVDDDEWQFVSQKVFSNMTTYMLPFSKLSSVTVSESDDRIRRFLSLGYDTKVMPDGTIAIKIDDFEQNAYFIVRCFDQEVTHVEGGSFVKLEDGAWLISADVQHIYVKLTPTEKNYYR